MKSKSLILLTLISAALAALPATADEPSESAKRTCRQVADANARAIKDAQKYKVDPSSRIQRMSQSWLEGVQNHMVLAAERADHLTERELAALGYSYCIERRPDGQ